MTNDSYCAICTAITPLSLGYIQVFARFAQGRVNSLAILCGSKQNNESTERKGKYILDLIRIFTFFRETPFSHCSCKRCIRMYKIYCTAFSSRRLAGTPCGNARHYSPSNHSSNQQTLLGIDNDHIMLSRSCPLYRNLRTSIILSLPSSITT